MKAERMDWSQLWYPGPTRVFTADEMARAGTDRPSRTLLTVSMVNYALAGFVLMQIAPASATAALNLLLVVTGVIAWFGLRRLWVRPDRRSLAIVSAAGAAMMLLGLIATIELNGLLRGQAAREWVVGAGVVLAMLLSAIYWFAAVFRAHQIEARLREQAEQQRALEMARQLAAAQIQPHFLFNSLASLQHWVQAKDDRAAPMLDALTGFLRATLPLFNRQRLALGDEAEAVRQYLAVMQMRLGERLRCTIDIASDAARAQVPPGLLLTLVENAVEHGVMPALAGAKVRVTARTEGARLLLTVLDTGPGLAPGATDGTGLANTRERLAQAFGPGAALTLENAADGGCIARLHCPLEST
jgi:signal transduction histidine kinase